LTRWSPGCRAGVNEGQLMAGRSEPSALRRLA
jgi:hypothetical protein